MLFDIMLFLIKAEVGTFEGNSDPLEKWRVKIVWGNESYVFSFGKMHVYLNYCEFHVCKPVWILKHNHYCLEKPIHYNLFHTIFAQECVICHAEEVRDFIQLLCDTGPDRRVWTLLQKAFSFLFIVGPVLFLRRLHKK